MGTKRQHDLNMGPSCFDEVRAALVSSSAFGKGRDKASYRAYGQNIYAAGGLVAVSRDEHDHLVNVGTAWADPLTAIWIALYAAANVLARPGARQHIDISMVEVISYHLQEYFTLSGHGDARSATRNVTEEAVAPYGVYRCLEGGWIAIAVSDDDEWTRRLAVLNHPEELADGRYCSNAERLRNRRDLDRDLDRVTEGRNGDALVAALQDHRVTAATVNAADDLLKDAHLHVRGFFHEVAHPRWSKPRLLTGLPWMESSSGSFKITRPPLLGRTRWMDYEPPNKHV